MVPKFRAYIKDLDEFEYNDIPHKEHFVYGNLIKGEPNDVDAIVGNLIEITDEYVNVEWWKTIQKGSAEQFTGLKDSNSDDIYENDLVLLDPDDPPYQVIFDEGKFEITGNGVTYDLGEEFMDCEIIGNIHEDEDLLGVEKWRSIVISFRSILL